jgi:hypothetical protein
MFTGTSQGLSFNRFGILYELNVNKPVHTQSNTQLWFLWGAEALNKQGTF